MSRSGWSPIYTNMHGFNNEQPNRDNAILQNSVISNNGSHVVIYETISVQREIHLVPSQHIPPSLPLPTPPPEETRPADFLVVQGLSRRRNISLGVNMTNLSSRTQVSRLARRSTTTLVPHPASPHRIAPASRRSYGIGSQLAPLRRVFPLSRTHLTVAPPPVAAITGSQPTGETSSNLTVPLTDQQNGPMREVVNLERENNGDNNGIGMLDLTLRL